MSAICPALSVDSAHLPPLPFPRPGTTTGERDRLTELQASISPTRLSLFLQCRLRFYFREVARLPSAKTAALHVGQTVHRVLKNWQRAHWRGEPLSHARLQEVYEEAWRESPEESPSWAEGEEAEQKQVGWHLLETYFREHRAEEEIKPEAVEVLVEADLRSRGLPLLRGVIDLVRDGRIIDFKTCAATPNQLLAAHLHATQLFSYAVLYRTSTGRREKSLELHHLVKLKRPKLVITVLPPLTGSQELRLYHLIEAYLEGLQRRDFVPSPGFHCANCEYFASCQAWR